MKTLRELVMSTLNTYSLKRFLCLFFMCVVGMSFIGSSVISCAPGLGELDSGDGDDDDDDDGRRDRDDDDDDDDDDEGDECKGDEVCERICEQIYNTFQERIECMEKGDVKVAKLEKVHDLLMEDFDNADELENNLDEISEGDDVDRDDFGDYLEIGGTKWIAEIKGGLEGETDYSRDSLPAPKKAKRLIVTLKWLIEDDNERAAKILSSVDHGDDILKELLLTLEDESAATGNCIEDASPITSSDTKAVSVNLWGLSGRDVSIFYKENDGHNDTATVTLRNTAGGKLYNALSCKYDDIDSENVFFYSADESNSAIFDLAFDLLVDADVCGVDNPQYGEDKACAKALMCWTAWQGAGGRDSDFPRNARSGFWNLVEERKSSLEYNGSDYNECGAEDFAKLFEND